MSAAATVPVTITPEAAARVAELGMQRELDRMVEHTRQSVAGLQHVAVTVEPPYETRLSPGINIEAYADRPFVEGDRTQGQWDRWLVTTFPPEVCDHFALLLREAPGHAG
jgi:hypothetical protein